MDIFILGAASLLLLSIFASKLVGRFGVPSLLTFLVIGMLAGSDGFGGIYFDNAALAQHIGIVALNIILFSAGLNTSWKTLRPIIGRGFLLSTFGVLCSTGLVAGAAVLFLQFSPLEAGLLGAAIAPTDAAAVFTILRAKKIHLSGNVQPILEFESGSNDPISVFLMTGFLYLLQNPSTSALSLIPSFFQQVFIGTTIGYLGGRALHLLLHHLELEFEGLYAVLLLASAGFIYGISQLVGGNGFLSIYLAGIVLGSFEFSRKKALLLFQDGLAWLMNIAMFLILGLLVFPKQLGSIIVPGLGLALFLILIARPASVYLSLSFSSFTFREKAVISWTGLRGAVPIILATFPLIANLPKAKLIFNLVFFVVLISVLLQGVSIPWVATWLKVKQAQATQEDDR